MFGRDFYPTPQFVIQIMTEGIDLTNKVVYEPEAGKADIVDFCISKGVKDIIASETHPELRKIVSSKCKVIADDCLTVTSEMISHVDLILMNPPFSADEKHITHMFDIAPASCTIRALCNIQTIENGSNRFRRRLKSIIDSNGEYISLGHCFDTAERTTNVEIALITIRKESVGYENEFEGFYLEEEIEEQANGIMPYNFIRDLVNRYIGAVKIYDEQLDAAIKMNSLTGQFFSSSIALSCTQDGKSKLRNDYKKDLQKAAWNYILDKMNMQKYATKGLKEDINKFVEQQQHIPFTMRNIYKMLEIVIGTYEQRIDKAVVEVFDRLTTYYHENRYSVEGWKTNSNYLINEKFIVPYMCNSSTGSKISLTYSGNGEIISDLVKVLCFLTGKNYDDIQNLSSRVDYPILVLNKHTGEFIRNDYGSSFECYNSIEDFGNNQWRYKDKAAEPFDQGKAIYGKWFDWGFFEIKAYKKGTMHFKFKDQNVWALFNQRIAKIKGFVLFEESYKRPRKAAA